MATAALPAQKAGGGKSVYNIEVYTADKRGAGTNANVFITLFGERGQSIRTKLDDKKNNFERNMIDHFVLESREPLGKLKKIRIEHDNKGAAPGWFLDQVVVTHQKTGNKYFFPCHKWLAKDEGDGQISRDLAVAGADGKVIIICTARIVCEILMWEPTGLEMAMAVANGWQSYAADNSTLLGVCDGVPGGGVHRRCAIRWHGRQCDHCDCGRGRRLWPKGARQL